MTGEPEQMGFRTFFETIENPEDAPQELVDDPATDSDGGLAVCIKTRRYKFAYNVIAARMEVNPPRFSKVMNGQGHFSAWERVKLMRACFTALPHQWEAKQLGRVSITEIRHKELLEIEAKYNALIISMEQAAKAV